MYICIDVYMYICIYVYMYICIICIYVYMYICIYVYMYTHAYTDISNIRFSSHPNPRGERGNMAPRVL